MFKIIKWNIGCGSLEQYKVNEYSDYISLYFYDVKYRRYLFVGGQVESIKALSSSLLPVMDRSSSLS